MHKKLDAPNKVSLYFAKTIESHIIYLTNIIGVVFGAGFAAYDIYSLIKLKYVWGSTLLAKINSVYKLK